MVKLCRYIYKRIYFQRIRWSSTFSKQAREFPTCSSNMAPIWWLCNEITRTGFDLPIQYISLVALHVVRFICRRMSCINTIDIVNEYADLFFSSAIVSVCCFELEVFSIRDEMEMQFLIQADAADVRWALRAVRTNRCEIASSRERAQYPHASQLSSNQVKAKIWQRKATIMHHARKHPQVKGTKGMINFVAQSFTLSHHSRFGVCTT